MNRSRSSDLGTDSRALGNDRPLGTLPEWVQNGATMRHVYAVSDREQADVAVLRQRRTKVSVRIPSTGRVSSAPTSGSDSTLSISDRLLPSGAGASVPAPHGGAT